MPDVITIGMCREAGFCGKGVKKFMDARGLDFAKFLKDGIPVEEAAKMNDAMVNKIIERAYPGWLSQAQAT